MDTRVRSVYVHAPFCARRCPYCDFAVHVDRDGDPRAWLGALRGELGALGAEGAVGLDETLETVYVGGGTPSLLGQGAMGGLAEVLGRARLRGDDLEWTAEANPESFDSELAAAWREAGVNRVSLGVQSFAPGVLRWMGRLHGPEGARAAVATARSAGFDNLSVDLMFGLPGRLERSWDDDLDEALRLDVPHVSLYGLTVEPETPLGRAVAQGREAGADEERYREEFLRASERLTSEGYAHYEVSSFARPGARARHNAVYWEGGAYLGLGNGAHSHFGSVRRWNERDWLRYRAAVEAETLPVVGSETLGPGEARLERIWLALRTDVGLDLGDLGADARPTVRRWAAEGLAVEEGARVRLTPEGWLVMDRLALELDAVRPG